jgi:solute carrier family 25 (peroxisomal adenine nucleotide transporter), member 17
MLWLTLPGRCCFSVVKSRLQAGHVHAAQYRSALHGLRMIAHEEGIEGLYKGMRSKLLQSVLTAAILFAGQRRFYELTKKVRTLLCGSTLVHLSR